MSQRVETPPNAKKVRVDQLLVDRGLAESKIKAQAMLLAGMVQLARKPLLKPGTKIALDANVIITGTGRPYVSRGGIKLAGAIAQFNINLQDKLAIDIGASTGGFTDCLLQHGIKQVYAIDVGYGQLHHKFRHHPQVFLRERTNARYLKPEEFPEPFDIAVIDVSFISLTKIIPAVIPLLKEPGELIALIKPQFESPKSAQRNPKLFKKGVVCDPTLRETVVADITQFATSAGLKFIGVVPSVIEGPAGNREYFIYFKKMQTDKRLDSIPKA